jgi:FtsP/CotA-like multicopper oxidase with cupredoxin domain
MADNHLTAPSGRMPETPTDRFEGMAAMAGRKQRMAEVARRNRVEIVEARLTRRDLVKLGLLTSAGFLAAKLGLSARADEGRQAPESPPTTAWVEELPIPEWSRAVDISELGPAPKREALIGSEGSRDPHQHWNAFDPAAADFHLLESRLTGVRWHRELPPDECWCWNGAFPGPRIHSTRGRPALIRFRNQLPTFDLHHGYGRPVLAPHFQGAHVAAESDGEAIVGFESGRWRDQLLFNRPEGFSTPGTAIDMGTREACALTYHDVFLGAGAQNTYRGLCGLQFVFDRHDSANEEDPAPEAWRLPSGAFDVPLVLHDRAFDAHGRGYFDLFDLDGLVGDKVTVNGRIQPFLRVRRRKYRFRVFNLGPARSYALHLSNDQEMVQVAEGGAMLPAPRRTRELDLGVGESAEIVLDFAPHIGGTQLHLLDLVERGTGGMPTGRMLPASRAEKVLRFDVDGGSVEDPSRVPDRFYDLLSVGPQATDAARTFVIERAHGAWTVNGQPFDPAFMVATPRLGTRETWTFVNRSGSWLSGLELHLGLHDVLARGSGAKLARQGSRGSVLRLAPGETISVWRRFADFTGTYLVRSRHGALGDQGLAFPWRVVA